MFNTTTSMVTVTAALSNIKTNTNNTKIHNNGSAILNSTTTHFNHTLSTSYHHKNTSSISHSSHNLLPKYMYNGNHHFMQNYNNQKVNSSSLTSNHSQYNSKKIEKVTNNNHKLAKPQQKGSYSTAPQVQERSKSKDSHHNKKQQNNNKATSSLGHKKDSYKGYDLKKYIKDELNYYKEEGSYYSSYNSSHVRNKREDIELPKHSAQYAPSNNYVIIDECFSDTCATQTPSQYLDQYNVDFGRFGTFKVSDSYYGRNRTAVKEHLQIAIDKIGEIFGTNLLNKAITHDCTLNLSPPPTYYGESGVYGSTPYPGYNNAQKIICNMRASSQINSDFRVLEHEMAHAIINAILQGKMDSMPRFFTEGFASAVMHYDSATLQQARITSANTIVVQHGWNDLFKLLEYVQPQYAHHYNYVVGEAWLLFCNHQSPTALQEYFHTIIREPFKSTFSVPVRNLIGIHKLEAKCSMNDFKSWLQNPDTSKGNDRQEPDKTTNNKDFVLTCNSKGTPNTYTCNQQPHIIKTIEDYIGKPCSLVKENDCLRPGDRIIVPDREKVIVIKQQQDGIALIQATPYSIIKYQCGKGWESWLEHTIKPILHTDNFNDCTEVDKWTNYIVGEIKRCYQVPLTQEDYKILPNDLVQPHNSTTPESENTTETPWLSIVGGISGILALCGVGGFVAYKCIKKGSAKTNQDDAEKGVELKPLNPGPSRGDDMLKFIQDYNQQALEHDRKMQDMHLEQIRYHAQKNNESGMYQYALELTGQNIGNYDDDFGGDM